MSEPEHKGQEQQYREQDSVGLDPEPGRRNGAVDRERVRDEIRKRQKRHQECGKKPMRADELAHAASTHIKN